MNFGAVDGASLRSGYALPACRPVNGGFINRRTVHLSKPKRCLDKPGHLSVMNGRVGIFIHGDNAMHNHSASEGCIILDNTIRNTIGESSDRELVVMP